MIRECVSAIRQNNIIIYRADFPTSQLKDFIVSGKQYVNCNETSKGNIFFDGTVVLSEWCKYKVYSLDSNFVVNDFIKIGEFGNDNFGVLLFKNCVGFAKFKDISLSIESPKLSRSGMLNLTEIVNNYISNLSYDYNQSTFSAISRNNKKKTDLQYHIFLLIHNALNTNVISNNIFRNFNLIKKNPCRSLTDTIEYENLSTVNELSNESVVDIFSGNTKLIPYKNSKNNNLARFLTNGTNKYVPQEILFEETIDTLDNSENQFIKYFLKWCLDIMETFQMLFKKTDNFANIELLNTNAENIKSLKQILSHSFLNNVSEMVMIPAYSTVLTKRDGYRQLFQLYLGIKSIPVSNTTNQDMFELIENKSLDVLYENYCFFEFSNIIAKIYGVNLKHMKYKVIKTEYSKTLEKRTNSNYFEFEMTSDLPRIRIHYNKNYVKESYSKSYDPDISLEIFDKSDKLCAIYLFDAKFKVEIYESIAEDASEETRAYKYEDINKMHTYRDALKCAKGAFILYPGTENKFYCVSDKQSDFSLLCGVGAFRLRPENKEDLNDLETRVRELLYLFNN